MVDRAKKISELTLVTSSVGADFIPVVSNTTGTATTVRILVSNLLANSANVTATALKSVAAPATANTTGVQGQIRYDTSYIYICTSTNVWKRAAISTW